MAVGEAPVLGIGSSLLLKQSAAASVADAHTALGVSALSLDLVSETLVLEEPSESMQPLIGTRQDYDDEQRSPHIDPKGGFVCRPRIGQLAELFELLLGDATGAAIVPLVPTLATVASRQMPAAALQIVTAQGVRAETWCGVACNEWTWSSEAKGAAQLEVNVLGKLGAAEAAPVAPDYALVRGVPTIEHSQLVLSGDLGAEKAQSFKLHVHNHLDEDGWANGRGREWLTLGDLEADLTLKLAWNATTAAYWQARYRARTYTTVTATYDLGGGLSVQFVFGGLVVSPPPNVSERGKQLHELKLRGVGKRTGDVPVIQVTVDDVGT